MKHSNIASADSMIQNVANMGERQMKLLQKIEKLTLYVIEQEKENKEKSIKTKMMNRFFFSWYNMCRNSLSRYLYLL